MRVDTGDRNVVISPDSFVFESMAGVSVSLILSSPKVRV